MNNEQFRKLLASNVGDRNGSADVNVPVTTDQRRAALGSRPRFGMSMTPRHVKGSAGSDHKTASASKFRSSAPRGSHLAQGYSDRTKARNDEDGDDTAKQIKALEELLKKGDIEQREFDRLRNEITGGDVAKTHLVKGLDFKLLERIRKGEDVHAERSDADAVEDEAIEDVDGAFDDLEAREVVAVRKVETEKKGQKADPIQRAGAKKSRNEILAELKASRQRAAGGQNGEQSSLTSKFKKIGASAPTSRLERDERGREVLIITDPDGNEKRKVRKGKGADDSNTKHHEPAMKGEVLGADVAIPHVAQPAAEESDDDIYADVGDDYNPLGDMDDEDSDAEDAKASAGTSAPAESSAATKNGDSKGSRNYFKDDPSTMSVLGNMHNPLQDPAVLAALAKKREQEAAANTDPHQDADEATRLKRKAAMLSGHDRDQDDMDMGFGTSRHDDAAEMDGSRVKISEWRDGQDDDEGEDGGHQEKKQRKRGPKKRKGDKNNINDVMKVIERQKQ